MHNNPFAQQAVLPIGYLLTSQGVPCIYYGTEQGFDGGGDNDRYVRECMFGGKWGAFNTTGVNFFDEGNPVYQGIQRVAAIRLREPALRYGRQYFREISSDGFGFGHPSTGQCTLAFSRILDTDEVLVAMNLEASPRQDLITVDSNLTPPGTTVVDLLDESAVFPVEELSGRAHVRVPLAGHQMALLKRKL
jgi:glycosidase